MPGVRPRRGERESTEVRKPQILHAAAELFASRGYSETSMDDVAVALGFRKPSIYYHFPGGKADLLYGINLAFLDSLVAGAAERQAADAPGRALQLLLLDLIAVQREQPAELVVYFEEARWLKDRLSREQLRALRRREGQFRGILRSIIERGVEAGTLVADDPDAAASAIVDAATSTYRLFQSSPDAATARLESLYSDVLGSSGSAIRPEHEPALDELRSALAALSPDALVELVVGQARRDRSLFAHLQRELGHHRDPA